VQEEKVLKRYPDEDFDDFVDRVHDELRQKNADAYADGKKVGFMGLGAGLCPQWYSEAEQKEWLRGFRVGAAEMLTGRKAA
jgi:ribosome modulation factor